MINVEQKDGYKVKLSRVPNEATRHHFDMYFFVPAELGFNSDIVPELTFYHGAIYSKRTYFSSRPRLPLAHGRLAEQGKLSAEQYRLSISLYGYQYAVGLEQSCHDLSNKGEEVTYDEVLEVVSTAQTILKRLRRNAPSDESLLKYYTNIDNYLSWFTEQRFLSLVSHLPRNETYKQIRQKLLSASRQEEFYRELKEYNHHQQSNDTLSRLSNKMRLLRRLIEHPVTLKEKIVELGKGEQKLIKGGVTGVVMTAMSLAMFEVRESLGRVSLIVILLIALLYILRDIFRDDLRNQIWRWLRKGRPKWRRQYFDVHSDQFIGRQLEWFDYQKREQVPEEVLEARKANVTQREEAIIHYGSDSKMLPTRFLSGYEQTRESIQVDLTLISRLMGKDSHTVYELKDNQVSKKTVQKRYLINLVTREIKGVNKPVLQRWKIIMSRSKIIEIEEVVQEAEKTKKEPDEQE